jgi:hypothetical protein
MSAHAAAELLKQQIPLLDYLVSQQWQPARRIARGRLIGLCPLHADRLLSAARSGAILGAIRRCHRHHRH